MGNLFSEEKPKIIPVNFEKIKSKYILQKVFFNLDKKKTLYIVKYN